MEIVIYTVTSGRFVESIWPKELKILTFAILGVKDTSKDKTSN